MVTVKLIVVTEESAVRAVTELINEVFGKEETKEKPRAKLILFEISGEK